LFTQNILAVDYLGIGKPEWQVRRPDTLCGSKQQ